MKPHRLLSVAGVVVLTACGDSGAQYQPILDGPPSPTYAADLTACQTLARSQKQFDQETVAAAVLGAGLGAALGAADEAGDALGGAVAGALVGGVSNAVDVGERREAIVVACLRGRGHRVVG